MNNANVINNSYSALKKSDEKYGLDIAIWNFPFMCSNIPAAPAYE
jgi:hypothetical protein